MFDTKTTCVVVVGAQWGDEGKGKLVDVLAERADYVVRYQGGLRGQVRPARHPRGRPAPPRLCEGAPGRPGGAGQSAARAHGERRARVVRPARRAARPAGAPAAAPGSRHGPAGPPGPSRGE